MPERTCKESFKIAADQLADTLKNLVHEGNVRRVIVKQDGKTVVEFPLTVGVIGTVFAPMLAAAGALAAVLSECTIEVERTVAESDNKKDVA
jgi:DNA-binding HxlR family transcriptional regulator